MNALTHSKGLSNDAKFTLVLLKNNTFAVKTGWGRYVRSPNKNGSLVNQQTSYGLWEQFKFVKNNSYYHDTKEVFQKIKDYNLPKTTVNIPKKTVPANIVALNCDQNFKAGGKTKIDCVKSCMDFKEENACNFKTCYKICEECDDEQACGWMRKKEKLKCNFNANKQNLGSTREECTLQCSNIDLNCSETDCKNICDGCTNVSQCMWIEMDKKLADLNNNINVPSKPKLTTIPGDERIVLKWIVDNNGGSEITKFLVVIYETKNSNSKVSIPTLEKPENDTLDRYTYVIDENLKNGVAYTVSVIAVNKKGYSDVSNISIVKPFEFLGKEEKLSDSGELMLKTSSVLQTERDSIISNLINNIETGDSISVQENLEKIQELKSQIAQPEFNKEDFLKDRDIRIKFT